MSFLTLSLHSFTSSNIQCTRNARELLKKEKLLNKINFLVIL